MLVSSWIINSTIHRRYDIDLIINLGETSSYVRSDIHLPKGQYVVKVVTERGNIAIYSKAVRISSITFNFTISEDVDVSGFFMHTGVDYVPSEKKGGSVPFRGSQSIVGSGHLQLSHESDRHRRR